MKQRKPLQRKTPMPRGSGLRRSSDGTQPGRGWSPTKPRRAPATAEEKRARAVVRARSGGVCEVCGMARASNYQHRKNRSQCARSELWAPSNGLDVCGTGTTGCHGGIHGSPRWAYDLGLMVASYLDPAAAPVYRLGVWVRLDDEGGVTRVGIGGAA